MSEIIGRKVGSCLEFVREGKTLRYDFKDRNFYRVLGTELKPIKKGQEFFRGITASAVISGFENIAYGKFIQKIKDAEDRCSNVATLLDRIAEYAHLEQYVVLGIDFPMYSRFTKPVTTLPKEIVKFFQEIGCSVNGRTFEVALEKSPELILNVITHVRAKYHLDLEVYNWAYEMIVDSTSMQRFRLLTLPVSEQIATGTKYVRDLTRAYGGNYVETFENGYGSEYKALFDYLVRADRAEANNFRSALGTYLDYRSMFRQMNMMDEQNNNEMVDGEQVELERVANTVEKYPKFLQVYHDIVQRNFTAYKMAVDEAEFSQQVNPELAYEWGKYCVLTPLNSEWVKQEGINNSHCVASYVAKILAGETQIVFMRLRERAETSLVTLEIRGGRIVQAKGYKNRSVNAEERTWLRTYAKSKELEY